MPVTDDDRPSDDLGFDSDDSGAVGGVLDRGAGAEIDEKVAAAAGEVLAGAGDSVGVGKTPVEAEPATKSGGLFDFGAGGEAAADKTRGFPEGEPTKQLAFDDDTDDEAAKSSVNLDFAMTTTTAPRPASASSTTTRRTASARSRATTTPTTSTTSPTT